MSRRLLPALLLGGFMLGLLSLASCDSGYDGQHLENQPPRTFLAVRDTNLAYNLCTPTPQGVLCSQDDALFTSTVFVSWSGVDPDGFVVGYDMRFYDEGQAVGPEEQWVFTTRRDTVVLLPIPPGQQTANVVFEVRAIDNEGLKDPNPARTVFPIINSPPEIRFEAAELPGDTTWSIFSFAWVASDPDGDEDLAAIEVAFNDTDAFVSLPPEARFATFVVQDPEPGAPTADARVYLGRGFSATEITVPGVRLDDDNTIHIRARDRTAATSPTASYPDPDLQQTWFVRHPTSDILLVNDYRSVRAHEVMPFHRATLQGYLGGGAFDEWDLSRPTTGTQYAENLPPSATPTLRELLKQWRYIYWVSDSVTDRVLGNNLALVSTFADEIIAAGGRLFVQVPFTAPPGGEIEFDNPAYDLLPAESIVTIPGTDVPPNLAISNQALVVGADEIPGTGRTLPTLRSERLAFMLPYSMQFATSVPLATGAFIDRDDNNAPWQGDSFVASMDRDRRVGLLALQVYSRNRYNFVGEDGSIEAGCLAIQYLLEGLTFPGTAGSCPVPPGN